MEFSDGAVSAIAEKAASYATGARSLRSILESLMLDLMYDLPTHSSEVKKVIITEDVVAGIVPPILVNKTDREVA